MSQTSVCGVPSGTPVTEYSNESLCFLWQEVGRHSDPHRLTLLREGTVKPDSNNKIEKQYLAVFREMKRRKLPFV